MTLKMSVLYHFKKKKNLNEYTWLYTTNFLPIAQC